MIAAAFLVLLRPLSIQCVLLLLLLLVGTVATILFLCCWHRKLRNEKIPIKSVLTRRSRSREAGFRPHHFRSEVCRHSPRHARRSARARVSEEKPLIESEPDSSAAVRKRRVKKRVQPEFYHSSSGSGNASLRCSMSSSADFSDDEEYSLKSGSVSPAPGDTLPWNLPRHERSKRKIQGGSVLDPAERAVLRIAGRNPKYLSLTAPMHIHSLGSYRENARPLTGTRLRFTAEAAEEVLFIGRLADLGGEAAGASPVMEQRR
ncbi:Microtubule-actin cross-linking factor 1, isoforms 1/2/3/5 [Labeo rohita]|uniref:Microtubule-actin cross-linking factor 1, isoforms 1/2/3/5 n=1 Tax=Labeo rohita TaxID=84645 RepID=A0ABQ8M3I7_LABRO|nr:Microtubule-actin cross-linking factor 1, isoforms 1/2/3/5 [Labeo rohita]